MAKHRLDDALPLTSGRRLLLETMEMNRQFARMSPIPKATRMQLRAATGRPDHLPALRIRRLIAVAAVALTLVVSSPAAAHAHSILPGVVRGF